VKKGILKVFSLIAASNAPNIPLENFSAMTRLDHDRAMAQVCFYFILTFKVGFETQHSS
jgi:hypothetical protein